MGDQRGFDCRNGEARANGKQAECRHEGDGPSTQQHGGDDADAGRRRCSRQRRFMLRGEIENDAGTESDGKPRQEPAGADFGRGPFAKPRRNGKLGARPRSAPDGPRPSDRPRPRAASRLALVHHRALPKQTLARHNRREHATRGASAVASGTKHARTCRRAVAAAFFLSMGCCSRRASSAPRFVHSPSL